MPDGPLGLRLSRSAAWPPWTRDTGVISPGGIGFDINCGMRLVLTNLTSKRCSRVLHHLVDRLFTRVPAGVGCHGFVRLSHDEFRRGCWSRARAGASKDGYGLDGGPGDDRGGRLLSPGADASSGQRKAIERGFNQIGTLGSGNHYLEIQVARPENVFDAGDWPRAFGITIPNQVVIMFHCGSRGFGHQVATDYLQIFLSVMSANTGYRSTTANSPARRSVRRRGRPTSPP